MNKYFNVPSHAKGGLNIDANGNPTKRKAVANIEKKEIVTKDNNNQLYILSDQLNTNKIAMKVKNIKGNDAISKRTREIFTEMAKRKNEELLSTSQNPTFPPPEKPLGGIIATGLPIITDLITKAIMKPKLDPTIPINPNTNLYGNTMFKEKGGVIKYALGGSVLSALKNLPQILNTSPSRADFIPEQLTSLKPDASDALAMPTPVLNMFNNVSQGINKGLSNIGGVLSAAKGITDQQFDNVSGDPAIPTTTGNKSFNPKVTDLMHLGAGVGSAIMALQRPEKEQLVNANYSIGDKLSSGTGIDPAVLINKNQNSFEAGNELTRRVSNNVGQYLNRMRGNSSQLADANSEAMLKAKQYNDQLALTRTGREDSKAINRQQEEIRTNIANSQNQAMQQDQVQNLFNQVTNIANGLDRKKYLESQLKNVDANNQRQLLLNLAILGSQNPNFKPGNIKYILDNIDSLSKEEIMENLIQFQD